MKENPVALITGGGTGGHLFPGIALAEEFQRRSRSHRLLFGGHHQADLMPRLLEDAADQQDALRLVIDLFDNE